MGLLKSANESKYLHEEMLIKCYTDKKIAEDVVEIEVDGLPCMHCYLQLFINSFLSHEIR